MPLFAIIRKPDAINNETLSASLVRRYPENVYRLSKGQWIVATSADQTARDFSKEIGIEAGKPYSGTLVVQIQSYYGLYDKKVWDWMKARSG